MRSDWVKWFIGRFNSCEFSDMGTRWLEVGCELDALLHPLLDGGGGIHYAAAEAGQTAVGKHAVVDNRPGLGTEMCFIGLIAAEKIKMAIAFLNGCSQ